MKTDFAADIVWAYRVDPKSILREYGKALIIQAHINYLNKKYQFYDESIRHIMPLFK